jgi:protoheme IX farnesyltransferase
VTQLPFCGGGGLDAIYLASSLTLGVVFIALAVSLQRQATRKAALRLYLFSLLYLALLFVSMVADVKL